MYPVCSLHAVNILKQPICKNISPMLQWCSQDFSRGRRSHCVKVRLLTRLSCHFSPPVAGHLLIGKLSKGGRGHWHLAPPSYTPVGSFACTLDTRMILKSALDAGSTSSHFGSTVVIGQLPGWVVQSPINRPRVSENFDFRFVTFWFGNLFILFTLQF